MIMFTVGGNSLKLARAFFILLVLVHLRPPLDLFQGLELEMLTISGAQRGRDKRSLNSKKPLLMTMAGSLHGTAAIGNEFTAATDVIKYLSFI